MSTNYNKFKVINSRPSSFQKKKLLNNYLLNNNTSWELLNQKKNDLYSLPIIKKNKEIKNNPNPSLHQFENQEEDNDLNIIKNMWNDLGVTSDYRQQFISYIKHNCNEKEKKEFYESEKNGLIKVRENLLKLSKEINKRDSNIANLKKIDESLQNKLNNNSINNSLIEYIIKIINDLRINSVNIIMNMNKLRENSSYGKIKGKFNFNKVNKAYNYNKDYLLKMKNDMNFINNSSLNRIINFNNGETNCFLTNCAPNPKKITKEDKITIPINDELNKTINKCEYILFQELMYNKIEEEKSKNNYNEFYNHPVKYKISNKKYIFNRSKDKTNMSISNYNITHPVTLSQALYQIKKEKGEKIYNKMFLNKGKNSNSNIPTEENNNNLLNKNKIYLSNELNKSSTLFKSQNKRKIFIERENIKSKEFDELLDKYQKNSKYQIEGKEKKNLIISFEDEKKKKIRIFNLKKEKDKNNNEKINKKKEKKEKNKDKFVKKIQNKWRRYNQKKNI